MEKVSLSNEKNAKQRFVEAVNALSIFGVLLLIFAILSFSFPAFFSMINLTNILRQQVPNLIVAIGITFMLIVGEIDISIGGSLALVIIVTGMAVNKFGIWPAVLIGILTGVAIGFINSVIVVDGKIPAFIATLGMMYMSRSVAFVLTKGLSFGHFPESFVSFYNSTVFKIPVVLIILIILYGISYVVLMRSRFGRHVFSVGSDKNISSLMGIHSNIVRRMTFIIVGLTVGIAGVLFTSRMGASQANSGRGFEFEVISAVIIGGCSLYGGAGNLFNSIIGVFIIALIKNGLILSHSNIYWQDFFLGAIIVIAVLLDTWRLKLRDRRLS
jgi:ribose/xylose/arabinose/galactoside ABC-type transport system permease subunit